MAHFQCIILLSLLLNFVCSQFISAPTDLTKTKGYLDIPVRYKEVPHGICELTPGVKSYTGYVDVEDEQHIFFWFFEARNQDPKTAPLTVWINGGPGSSSMIGLFQENGPCGVDSSGNLYYNPYSWNNVSNMIYIDQPSTVGFSYSVPVPGYYSNLGNIVELPDNKCPPNVSTCGTYSRPDILDVTNSTKSSAPNFWKALQGFMGAFPQYSRESFHFTTESYGGHYGPVYFKEQNALINAGKLKGGHVIDLKSVMVGNGWYDPLIQNAAYYNFTVSPGNTYDYFPFSKQTEEKMYNSMYGPGNCYDQTIQCYNTGRDDVCDTANSFCAREVEEFLDVYAHRDEYDIRQLSPPAFPYSFYLDYLQLPKVQQAIGAYVNFSDYSATVGDAFANTGDDSRTEGTVADVRKLISQGIYFIMYNGDADYNCNWLGNQVVAENVGAPGYSNAGFENVTTPDGVVHGVVKQSNTFGFVRVYESGHEVPFFQPVIALSMLERVIKDVDVATGKTKISHGGGYSSSGPAESTYREGISTVQFHVLSPNATYNHTTNEPNPPSRRRSRRRRSLATRPRPILNLR